LQENSRLILALDDLKDSDVSTEEEVKAATGALWLLRDQELYATTKGRGKI
jgi:hypothetical protein